MTISYTPNLNLAKPGVGTEDDAWGALLNANMDAIDEKCLLKTGGTITGALTVSGALTTSGGVTVNNLNSAVTLQALGVRRSDFLHVTSDNSTRIRNIAEDGGTVNGELRIDPSGYVGVGLESPPTYPIHHVTGAHLTAGGAWTNASSNLLKANFTTPSGADILAKLASLPVQQYNYKLEPHVQHMTPMAEDFYAMFGIGSPVALSPADLCGVLMVAVQELAKKII